MDTERVKDLLRKLLSLAQDSAATPAEAALAAERAARLAARHKLDLAELGETSRPEDMVASGWMCYLAKDGQLDRYNEEALFALASAAYRIVGIAARFSKSKGEVYYVGTEADVEVTRWMYRYLRDTCYRLADERIAKLGRRLHHPMAYRRHFLLGAATAIRTRAIELQAARKREAEDTPPGQQSMALVVVRDTALAEAKLTELLGPAASTTNVRGAQPGKSAFQYGAEAGRGVSFNRPVASGVGRRALPGS